MVAYPAQMPWQPADDGLLDANYDPILCAAATQVTNGVLYLQRFNPRQTLTIGTLWFGMSVSATAPSTGTFCGLYSAGGTLLTGSADAGSLFALSDESVKVPLTTPQTIAAGVLVYAALLVNMTAAPTLYRALGDSQFVSFADWRPAATIRFGTNGTGLTSLPASITMANNSISAGPPRSWWVGVS